MKFRDLLFLSVRTLRSSPLETILEVCATALGVALFASSLSLIQHYTRDMEETSQDIMTRSLFAYPRFAFVSSVHDTPVKNDGPIASEDMRFPLALLARAKAECPAIRFAWADEIRTEEGPSPTVYAVRRVAGDFFQAHDLTAALGSLFAWADYSPGSQVVVVGSGLARRILKSSTGVGTPLTEPFGSTVVGILREHPERFLTSESISRIDESIITPLDPDGVTDTLWFTAVTASRTDEARSQLQAFFDSLYGKDLVTVAGDNNGWADNERRMSLPLLSLLVFLSGAVLFVIVVNILSLHLGSVARRTRQIGLASAVGASLGAIFRQYIAEFALTGVSGGILGVLAAVGLTAVLQGLVNPQGIALPGLRLVALPGMLGMSAAIVLCANFLFSLLPALQAIRTRSADAMRYE